MISKEKTFLDTSVQIQKIFGYHLNRGLIAQKLKDKPQFVSRYILMEYKRRVVRSFVLFYSCLRDEENISEALKLLASKYSGRIKSDIIMIISMLMREEELEKEQALIRLESLIDWELLDYFESEVEHIKDTIDCEAAKAEARIPISCSSYARQLRCRKNERQCRTDEFVGNNRSVFKKIGSSKQIGERLSDLCSKVCQQPEEARGRNCMTLGDTIISIEAPTDSVVCSYDKAFEVICKEIGKEYDIFPFIRKRKKKVETPLGLQ